MSAERDLARDERGAGALEFAILAPVLLTCIFGIIQFGWALHCAASVNFALEEASRTLLLNPNTNAAQLQSKVQSSVASLADGGAVTVTLTDTVAGGVTVTTATSTYKHAFTVPFLPKYNLTFRSDVAVIRP